MKLSTVSVLGFPGTLFFRVHPAMAQCVVFSGLSAQADLPRVLNCGANCKKNSYGLSVSRRTRNGHICYAVTEENLPMLPSSDQNVPLLPESSSATSDVPQDPISLKAELLSAVAGLDRGLVANDDDVEAAEVAARKLEAAGGNAVEFPRDIDKLQGQWRLAYSSAFSSGNLGGSRPGPPLARLPVTLGQVYQRIDVLSREFDNVVEIRSPAPWPFPPLITKASLGHTFELPGGATVKIIFEKTTLKAGGMFSELPPLELPRLPDFLRSRDTGFGQFDVTYLDDNVRVTRGDRGELRVFVKL